MASTHRHLVIGCGYLGSRVARRWHQAGGEVSALTRSEERAATFRQAGWQPLVGDVCGDLPELPTVDVVLYAVGYDRSAVHSIEQVYVDGLRQVIERLPEETGRLVYISSTGVYGATESEWVDEETPCAPTRAGGSACLAAEQALQQSRFADRTTILRLAGIYGPDRVPRLDAIRQGEPIDAPAEGYLNLIHVDDAAQVVDAALQQPAPRTYCVSDGSPCLRREYIEEIARCLGAPPPRFRPSDPDSAAGQRAAHSKRISNSRMRDELNVALRYPTYRQGLAAILTTR